MSKTPLTDRHAELGNLLSDLHAQDDALSVEFATRRQPILDAIAALQAESAAVSTAMAKGVS